nr:MAG TPA: hypothetical protein [Caudoviricetes sp.]
MCKAAHSKQETGLFRGSPVDSPPCLRIISKAYCMMHITQYA